MSALLLSKDVLLIIFRQISFRYPIKVALISKWCLHDPIIWKYLREYKLSKTLQYITLKLKQLFGECGFVMGIFSFNGKGSSRVNIEIEIYKKKNNEVLKKKMIYCNNMSIMCYAGSMFLEFERDNYRAYRLYNCILLKTGMPYMGLHVCAKSCGRTVFPNKHIDFEVIGMNMLKPAILAMYEYELNWTLRLMVKLGSMKYPCSNKI